MTIVKNWKTMSKTERKAQVKAQRDANKEYALLEAELIAAEQPVE